MKNAVSKSIILAVAIAIAIGSVLIFVKYEVTPPEDISAVATSEDVFIPDIKMSVSKFNPDSLTIKEAENAYNALVDRANIFNNDELIGDTSVYDSAIAEASEKFAKAFISWCIDKFGKSTWNTDDHEVMVRLITKLRKVNIDGGAKKALSPESLSSLTEIESVVNDYKKAWALTRNTNFSGYQNVRSVCNEARTYATRNYLKNCTNLVNALNAIGAKQENSCYIQLFGEAQKLHNLNHFENRKAYEKESSRIYYLIKDFKETNVFGVSTANHAKILANMQERYDRNAENYEWPDERQVNSYN